MPSNAKMPESRRSFEAAGFAEVRTVLSSGNVVFDARSGSEATLEHKAEAAIRDRLGRTFFTIVRPAVELSHLVQSDVGNRQEVARGMNRMPRLDGRVRCWFSWWPRTTPEVSAC